MSAEGKDFKKTADICSMENRNGFSYLLPKSGSRSHKKRLFFILYILTYKIKDGKHVPPEN